MGSKISYNLFTSLLFYLFFAVMAVMAFPVGARAAPRLSIVITAEKEIIVEKEGEQTVSRVPVEKTSSNDVLVYTITYLNEGDTEAVHAEIVDPVPENTVYVLNSASGNDSEKLVSIDNGMRFQPEPAKYITVEPDGTQKEHLAPSSMYTHVKWVLQRPVLPGSSGRLEFKVSVK